MAKASLMKLPSQMMSTLVQVMTWCRQACVRQQAITLTRVNQDLVCHMASLDYNELTHSTLNAIVEILWRSEARRVVPWSETLHERVQGRSQGTTLSASDLHNARATILNPFYDMEYIKIKTNTLETCKNPRPTSGWSELTKSCTTSTMNFHVAYFSWIPQNNARLKLSCKFGESKCNPC